MLLLRLVFNITDCF